MGHEKHQRPRTAARFSFDEIRTDQTWDDGRPIYRKIVDLGALPNATQKSVQHGIVANAFVGIRGFANNPVAGITIHLPHVDTTSLLNQIYLDVRATTITVLAGTDRSGYNGHVILEYLKA